jgi:hypothetical protein
MSVLLSPVGNGQQFFDNNGIPLAGGYIYTYQAGSTTPLATYTDVNGNIANTNPIVLSPSGRIPYELWLTFGFSYKFVIKTVDDVLIQTLDNLYPILQTSTAVGDTIPPGLIAIWSGSTGSIPSGWVICDGSNGTPNLRDSFIVGAGNNYAVGAAGGSADSIVVSHTHSTTVSTQSLTGSVTGISESFNSGGGTATGVFTKQTGFPVGLTPLQNDTNDGGAFNFDGSHTHTVTNQSTGVSGTGANLPPYYALAFIMKT